MRSARDGPRQAGRQAGRQRGREVQPLVRGRYIVGSLNARSCLVSDDTCIAPPRLFLWNLNSYRLDRVEHALISWVEVKTM